MFNASLSFIALLYLAIRVFLYRYYETKLPEPTLLYEIISKIFQSVHLIELIIYLSTGIISILLNVILKNGYKNNRSIQIIIIAIIVALSNAVAAFSYLVTTISSIETLSRLDGYFSAINKGFTEDFLSFLILLTIIFGICTIYCVIFLISSLFAIIEATRTIPERLIYRVGEEEYILESGSERFSDDIGALYSNIENSTWRFNPIDSSSSTQTWLKFIDSIDYKKDIRMLRRGSEILGVLFTEGNRSKLEVRSLHLNHDRSIHKVVKEALAQDYIRRKIGARWPTVFAKVKENDKKTQMVLLDSGWVKVEKDSTVKKIAYKYTDSSSD